MSKKESEVWLTHFQCRGELLIPEWAMAVQSQALPPRTCSGHGWATTSKSVLDARGDNPNSLLQRLGGGIVCY